MLQILIYLQGSALESPQTCGKIGPETKNSCIDIKSLFGTVFDELNP